jgi:hypothetical protein
VHIAPHVVDVDVTLFESIIDDSGSEQLLMLKNPMSSYMQEEMIYAKLTGTLTGKR